jgi:hypothetical protein
MGDLKKVKCCLYRGGTSRGVFFHEEDLPITFDERRPIFLGIMGSPDARQIDGLGGATSHTSKVVIISASTDSGIDINYDFYQIGIDSAVVDRKGMCGNLLAAAGLFAVDEKIIKVNEPFTEVSIKSVNTGKRFTVKVPVKNGRSVSQGDYYIDGVSRPGAEIIEEFIEPEGSMTGKLLPAKSAMGEICIEGTTYRYSIVDSGHISIFVDWRNFGLNGNESPLNLNQQPGLLSLLEDIRGEGARICGFVENAKDAKRKSPALPRLALVGPASFYKGMQGREFQPSEMDLKVFVLSMQRFHQSIAVTTAVCIAHSCVIPGSLVFNLSKTRIDKGRLRIGHPSGVFDARIIMDIDKHEYTMKKVVFGRTARRLMEGFAYYPTKMETINE